MTATDVNAHHAKGGRDELWEADFAKLERELASARQCARVLAHAWDHDTKPPDWALKLARQWGPRGEVIE